MSESTKRIVRRVNIIDVIKERNELRRKVDRVRKLVDVAQKSIDPTSRAPHFSGYVWYKELLRALEDTD